MQNEAGDDGGKGSFDRLQNVCFAHSPKEEQMRV